MRAAMAARTCWRSASVHVSPRWALHGRHALRMFSSLCASSGASLTGMMWSAVSALRRHPGSASSQNGTRLRCAAESLRQRQSLPACAVLRGARCGVHLLHLLPALMRRPHPRQGLFMLAPVRLGRVWHRLRRARRFHGCRRFGSCRCGLGARCAGSDRVCAGACSRGLALRARWRAGSRCCPSALRGSGGRVVAGLQVRDGGYQVGGLLVSQDELQRQPWPVVVPHRYQVLAFGGSLSLNLLHRVFS